MDMFQLWNWNKSVFLHSALCSDEHEKVTVHFQDMFLAGTILEMREPTANNSQFLQGMWNELWYIVTNGASTANRQIPCNRAIYHFFHSILNISRTLMSPMLINGGLASKISILAKIMLELDEGEGAINFRKRRWQVYIASIYRESNYTGL